MQGFMKIVIIVVAVMISAVILTVMKEDRGGSGYGPLGIVIALALFAGIKAIWNYDSKKPEENNTTDIDKLDKN